MNEAPVAKFVDKVRRVPWLVPLQRPVIVPVAIMLFVTNEFEAKMFPVTCRVDVGLADEPIPTKPVMSVVPVMVGEADRTTEPVPVERTHPGAVEVVPVPVCERNAAVEDVEPARRVPDPEAPP